MELQSTEFYQSMGITILLITPDLKKWERHPSREATTTLYYPHDSQVQNTDQFRSQNVSYYGQEQVQHSSQLQQGQQFILPTRLTCTLTTPLLATRKHICTTQTEADELLPNQQKEGFLNSGQLTHTINLEEILKFCKVSKEFPACLYPGRNLFLSSLCLSPA